MNQHGENKIKVYFCCQSRSNEYRKVLLLFSPQSVNKTFHLLTIKKFVATPSSQKSSLIKNPDHSFSGVCGSEKQCEKVLRSVGGNFSFK